MTMAINLGIFLALVATIIVVIFVIRQSKSNFDITVDPVRPEYKQNIYQCPTPLKEQGNGLNTQNDGSDVTICDFVKKFGDKLVYPETDPYDVVPRQYCALMYENFHDDCTERWESLGVCEKDMKDEFETQCPLTM